MESELRNSGTGGLGGIPWASCPCHFYETENDLLEILVLYFQSGLENNEYCLWIACSPISTEIGTDALTRAFPAAATYLASGQIEIISHSDLDGVLDATDAIRWCEEKLNLSLVNGYAGMRASGVEAWVGAADRAEFAEYTRQLNGRVIYGRLIILLTYSLRNSTGSEILDVMRAQGFAIARRNGQYEVLGSARLTEGKKEFGAGNAPLGDLALELASVGVDLRNEIRERKRTENELGAQKEILQTILDHIPLMINLIDEKGRFRMVNREWERKFGWSLQEMHGRDIFADFYPDPDARKYVRQFVESASCEWADFRTTVKAGTLLDTTWTNIRLSDGSRLGIGQDITERKQSEDALREGEERFRQLTEHIGEVFWMRDVNTNRVLYVSPAYESVWRRARENLYQSIENLIDTIHADDRPVFEDAFKGGNEFDVEYRIIRPDGSLRWIRDRAFPIRDGTGTIYRLVGIAEDMTDRKLVEERLKAKSEKLRALSARVLSTREEERTRIAREIHDELGSALAALKWELATIEKVVSGMDDRTRVSQLQEKVRDMTLLVDSGVTTIRRIASDLRPSILDDLGLVEAVEWQAQQFQARTGILCRVDCPVTSVSFNPEEATAVFRIVQEALTNVLRHARATHVDIVMQQNASEFLLTVNDNGRGITEEEKSHFLSLGLLGMHERARLVGGEMEINSTTGKGTTIALRLIK